MRHIFLVHTTLTEHVAERIIAHEQLPRDSVTFLTQRQYEPLNKAYHVAKAPVDDHYTASSFPVYRKFWKTKQAIRKFDARIDELCQNQRFALYLPRTGQRPTELMLSHPKCERFYLFEEGLAAYLESWIEKPADQIGKLKPAWFHRLLWKLNFGRRLKPELAFFRTDFAHAYGIFDDAFGRHAQRTTIGVPFPKEAPPEEGSVILVLDAFLESGAIRSATLIMALWDVLAKLESLGVKRLYFKYHPSQLTSPYPAKVLGFLKDAWNDRVEMVELPAQAPLESYAAHGGVSFVVSGGSTGLYAARLGRPVFSYVDILLHYEPRFEAWLKQVPDLYWEGIERWKP